MFARTTSSSKGTGSRYRAYFWVYMVYFALNGPGWILLATGLNYNTNTKLEQVNLASFLFQKQKLTSRLTRRHAPQWPKAASSSATGNKHKSNESRFPKYNTITRRTTPNQHRHEGHRKINTSAPTTPQQLGPKINTTATQ
jgi:hypothetical protein